MNNQTLFPSEILVELVDGQPLTDSIKVSKHFGKQHKDVLRNIRSLLNRTKDEGHRRNFAPMSGLDERNRKRKYYRLTRQGFFFIVTGFTGEKAETWKWNFLDQFDSLEKQLTEQAETLIRVLKQIKPYLCPVVEGTKAGLNRTEIAEPLGKSVSAVTYHRNQARSFGLLS